MKMSEKVTAYNLSSNFPFHRRQLRSRSIHYYTVVDRVYYTRALKLTLQQNTKGVRDKIVQRQSALMNKSICHMKHYFHKTLGF